VDSLTQIVLGGAVGEAVLGKKVGNKAVLWGAIGGTIPDLDTIPGQFLDTVSKLDIHRGFSHSIVFAVLVAPIFGFLLQRLYRKKVEANTWEWTQLMFLAIFTHPLLDIFTTWGTQLLWPMDWRIAIQSIFVIDPVYTIPFLILLIFILFLKRNNPTRRKLNRLGLIISTSYLFYTIGVKLYVNRVFSDSLEKQKILFSRFETRPTPFNTILWTSNAETNDAFYIGYYSLFDKEEIEYYEFKKNHELLKPYRNNQEIERLLFLTKGYYALKEINGGLEMYDLRFGLTEGFDQGKGYFVYTYLLKEKNGRLEITEKPKSFEGMKDVIGKLVQRIGGTRSF
jgi:inner membrane protein